MFIISYFFSLSLSSSTLHLTKTEQQQQRRLKQRKSSFSCNKLWVWVEAETSRAYLIDCPFELTLCGVSLAALTLSLFPLTFSLFKPLQSQPQWYCWTMIKPNAISAWFCNWCSKIACCCCWRCCCSYATCTLYCFHVSARTFNYVQVKSTVLVSTRQLVEQAR